MFFSLNAIKDYRKSQKQMAKILNEATMTNTPMSDLDPKMKELLEAARYVVDTGERNGLYRLGDAIAAFGPPKPEKEYTMPEWLDFALSNHSVIEEAVKQHKCFGLSWGAFNAAYNAIRTATSRTKAAAK